VTAVFTGQGPPGTRLRRELDLYPDFQGGKALGRGLRAAEADLPHRSKYEPKVAASRLLVTERSAEELSTADS
jgi:hypothetical protein